MKSSTIAGGIGLNKRNPFDYYSTPKEVTIALLEFLKTRGIIYSTPTKPIMALEPCCGEGAISTILTDEGFFVESHDIRFTEYAGVGVDYFSQTFQADIIITNPPFNLAPEFIRKACEEANVVCMLLKAHFWHAKKRLELWNNFTPRFVLPLTWRPDWVNDGRGSSPTMDFQWTIWDETAIPNWTCTYEPLKKPLVKRKY